MRVRRALSGLNRHGAPVVLLALFLGVWILAHLMAWGRMEAAGRQFVIMDARTVREMAVVDALIPGAGDDKAPRPWLLKLWRSPRTPGSGRTMPAVLQRNEDAGQPLVPASAGRRVWPAGPWLAWSGCTHALGHQLAFRMMSTTRIILLVCGASLCYSMVDPRAANEHRKLEMTL